LDVLGGLHLVPILKIPGASPCNGNMIFQTMGFGGSDAAARLMENSEFINVHGLWMSLALC